MLDISFSCELVSSLSAHESSLIYLEQSCQSYIIPMPFPFEPKETKIREDIFSEMKEREESSSIFVVLERIYNVKFNMNAQTWLLNPTRRGLWN